MNYLNLHILQNLPFSNVNRGDDGAPKTVVYGGTTRARISSQAKKRAARVLFESTNHGERTVRSRRTQAEVVDRVTRYLTNAGQSPDDATLKKIEAAAKKELMRQVASKDSAKDTLVWVSDHEIGTLARKIAEKHLAGANLDDVEIEIGTVTPALTIALFGRMFAARPEINMEAAAQVSHAFTTHTATIEVDYFTAVDDVPAADASAGAAHLDLAQYTTGVFYQTVVIDRAQLHRNWADINDLTAKDRVAACLTALISALPTGKQNSAAHHSLPAFVLAEVAAQPVSYAEAFDQPVTAKGNGLVTPSIDALIDFRDRARAFQPTVFTDQVWAASTYPVSDLPTVSAPDLAQAAAGWLVG